MRIGTGNVDGFVGVSDDDTVDGRRSVVGGLRFIGAFTASTAYLAGDVLTDGGRTWRALVPIPPSNTTAPSAGPVWADAGDHRGQGEVRFLP